MAVEEQGMAVEEQVPPHENSNFQSSHIFHDKQQSRTLLLRRSEDRNFAQKTYQNRKETTLVTLPPSAVAQAPAEKIFAAEREREKERDDAVRGESYQQLQQEIARPATSSLSLK